MTWSTREVAELAGTTLKAVRHYHEVGLLEEPERAPNGYKRYGVDHLVRLLRIKRLVDLGVPLSGIAAMGDADEHPEEALRVLDAELAASIERLQRVRAELAMILRHRAPTDLPPGFSQVAGDLSDADRSLILVYSRLFAPERMRELHEMLLDFRRGPGDAEFDALPADADEEARQQLATVLTPYIRALMARHPWLGDPGAHALRGTAFAERVIGKAIVDLYNPAQLDVLYRVHLALAAESGSDDARGGDGSGDGDGPG
ncbi:MerR family transcriptional regulator [Streptomyces sp. SM12]|uniref:helix-turn-helix domain-containing protein n=1 Tax=Streptomyces sp. SM12 TaxID=1071602 RepID=UPI000CD54023|nr:MerR family transcriptional regulator [Streptomyces sp. SM12]